MGYAIIQTGGRQFRVSEGETVRLPNLEGEVGANVEFDVLGVGGDSGFTLGSGKVTGTILTNGRAKKIIVFKFKRRKQYKRKQGHRQGFTSVKIDSISA